uniref:Post-GPI attachment to proteins factor 3 n=1 Tax=Polytomella parva TaxID=51329 RepID=A0A7S0VAC8_9CHLO|mmetsp:Transcript_28372/g.52244  ORF Transcript_28372/g.52244 Transcript_28372/m.52244 type:complete len:372 (+) Transcript_28372:172-1287(+)
MTRGVLFSSRFYIFIVILSIGCFIANASEGDNNPAFWYCLQECKFSGCVRVGLTKKSCVVEACHQYNKNVKMPLSLSLTKWSCEDDCKYHCMLATESARRSKPIKYYGKWPFHRVYGAQEIASVIFSLLNLLSHIICVLRLRRFYRKAVAAAASASTNSLSNAQLESAIPRNSSSLSIHASLSARPNDAIRRWFLLSMIHLNAWVWSAVFHVRDVPLTERFDYLSAILVVFFSLYVALMRNLSRHRVYLRTLVQLSILCVFVTHLTYMLYVKFHYSWNVTVCVTVGIIQAAAWLHFCFRTRHPYRYRMLSFIVLLNAATMLELFDFPPIYNKLVDAHALWHAVTVPLTFLFYSFIQGDISYILDQETRASN